MNASRQAPFKRKSPKGIAASAILMGGAIVALGMSDGSGVSAMTLSQAVSAGANGLAVEWTMLGAQSQVPGAVSRLDVNTLALNKSLPLAPCPKRASVCMPLIPLASGHEWSGRVAIINVSTSNGTAATGLAGAGAATSGGSSTLSGAAPLTMPAADSGTYGGQIQGGPGKAWTFVGLPDDLAAQVRRILVGQLKVTGAAQSGDYYRVVYETAGTQKGDASARRVTALQIRFAGRTYRAVWFTAPGRGTTGDYYSFDGQHLAAEPFAMPLNYVRVSSPFGFRIHPVSGEPSFHTGVDLTAAQGTPVVAAAAGTVQFVGVDSGYGKHVVVRHVGGYTTYYAHLSAFARGLRVGAKISEGDPVGAVGQTGVATGPHLHFEVRLNNRPVEPLRLTARFSAVPLGGRQREAFNQVASVAGNRLAGVPAEVRTASNAGSPQRTPMTPA